MSTLDDQPLRPPPRLVVGMLAAALASVMVLLWASDHQMNQERAAIAAITDRVSLAQSLDLLEATLRLPMAVGDREAIHEGARAIVAQKPSIAAIHIDLADGSTLAVGDATGASSRASRDLRTPVRLAEQLFFGHGHTIDAPNRRIGRIEAFSHGPDPLVAPRLFDGALPVAFAAVTLLWLGVTLWVRHRVLCVCRCASALAAGRFDEVKRLGGRDEMAWATGALAEVADFLAEQVDRVHGRNAALVRDVALTEDHLARQSGFVASLVAPLAEHSLPDRALCALVEHAGAAFGALFVPHDDDPEQLRCVAVAGLNLEPDDVRPLDDDAATSGRSQPRVLPALEPEHPWMIASGRNVPLLGVVAVPLLFRGQSEGVAFLADGQSWSGRDIEFLRDVASPLAIALANRRAFEATLALAATLELRHDELLRQRDQLAVVDRLRSQFVANISHELRTPLNAIIGYTELVVDECFGPLAPEQREPLENVLEASNHLLTLVGQVLDLSRAEAGAIDLDIKSFELREVVDDVTRMAHALCRDRPYTPSVRGPSCTITSDPSRLRQILTNLVGNAIKFTEQGSVEIETRLVAGTSVEITVSDTGPGIDPAQFELIFEEFRQADGSTTRAHDGAGLGLAISRKLALALGGSLTVASARNQGSRFTLTLPRQRHKAPPPLPSTPTRSARQAA